MIRPLVVVSNVIVDSKDRFLIGKHKDGHKENMYAFAGGKVEDETIEEAFWRELEEETGLVKPKDKCNQYIFHLGNSEIKFKDKRFLVMFYIARYVKEMGEPKNTEPDRHYPWEWLSYAQLASGKFPLAHSTLDFMKLYSYFYEYGA